MSTQPYHKNVVLCVLQGGGGAASELRTYDYMTYNDLGPARPTLGGNTTLPYPRRTATKAPGKDNLPYGEHGGDGGGGTGEGRCWGEI